MNSIAVSIILWIATISGMKTMPDVSQAWRTLNAWTAGMEHPVFVATSKSIVDECKRKPGSYLVLPLLLYGAHEILLDNKHVRYYGDPKFNKANVVMNYPFIRCDEIDHGKEITWVAHSYSPYFARFLSWPIVINDRPYNDLFCRYIYIGSVFCLLIISVFSFLIMSGKENKRTLYSFCASSILMSIYFAFSVTPLLNIEMSPILANKISDSSLTVGFTLLLLSFFLDRVLNKYIFLTHLILSVIAVTIHTMGSCHSGLQSYHFIFHTYNLLLLHAYRDGKQ